MKASYFTKLAGTSFRQDAVAKLKDGVTPLRAVAEPDNEYDKYAVRVDAMLSDGWAQIGYFQKGKNQEISSILTSGGSVSVVLKEVTGLDKDTLGVNVAVEYGEDDSAIDPADMRDMVKQEVFIGDDDYIYFDEVNHKAYDKDGHELLSGSNAEKMLRPEVNLTYPAKALAKSTGAKQEDIMSLWDHNRDLSAGLGTLVHEALEHYLRYAPVMRKIDENKERKHTAKNWMPDYLGDIVDKFVKASGLKDNKDVEVRIKSGRRTGIVDCLLMNSVEESFRLWDYKVTKELKPVDYNGLGKHTKYSVQQSFYKDIIEEVTGFTCEEIALWQWDGEKWSKHVLESVNLEGLF